LIPRKSVLAAALGSLLDGDLVPESLDAMNGAVERYPTIALVEVSAAEVFVRDPVADDAVGEDQNGVCDRDERSFGSSPGG